MDSALISPPSEFHLRSTAYLARARSRRADSLGAGHAGAPLGSHHQPVFARAAERVERGLCRPLGADIFDRPAPPTSRVPLGQASLCLVTSLLRDEPS